MRWGAGGRARSGSARAATASWAARLGDVGAALDRTGLGLREPAVAWAGDDAWVAVWVWWAGRARAGWVPVTLVVYPDGRLSPLDPAAVPPRGEAGQHLGPPWAPRLAAVGAWLDRLGRPVRDPSVVPAGGGFAVAASVGTPSGTASEAAGWELGPDALTGSARGAGGGPR